MDKHELARLLARQSHRSYAQAADYVDALVHRLIKSAKQPPCRSPEEEGRSAAASASIPKAKP
jgi:hypothetical protein